MKPELLKAFRINLLTQFRAAGRLGMDVKQLVVNAKSTGFPSTTDEDVLEEIDYLIGKRHLEKLPQEVSPEVESWKITDAGRDYLAVNHL